MIKCTKFKPYEKGSLLGFLDLEITNWGIEIKGCTLHMKNGKRWINTPSQEFKNEAGETKYSPIVRFINPQQYNNFSEEAKKAVDKFCQEQQQFEKEASEVPF